MDEFQGITTPDSVTPEKYTYHRKLPKKAKRQYVVKISRVSEKNYTLIDFKKLQSIVNKSRSTIYRWVDKGILPQPITGKHVTHNMWSLEEVNSFIAAHFKTAK